MEDNSLSLGSITTTCTIPRYCTGTDLWSEESSPAAESTPSCPLSTGYPLVRYQLGCHDGEITEAAANANGVAWDQMQLSPLDLLSDHFSSTLCMYTTLELHVKILPTGDFWQPNRFWSFLHVHSTPGLIASMVHCGMATRGDNGG